MPLWQGVEVKKKRAFRRYLERGLFIFALFGITLTLRVTTAGKWKEQNTAGRGIDSRAREQ